MTATTTAAPGPRGLRIFLRVVLVIALLYAFLVAIKLMGSGFKLLGEDFAKDLVTATKNPIIGLFIGILTTALIQSSSVTTSMVVGLVSAPDGLPIEFAIPIIMGANIGTSVTNAIVSLGHMGNRGEFRKAFSGAIVHDVFNWLTVAILLPLEMATGYLHKTAEFLADKMAGSASPAYESPITTVVSPAAKSVVQVVSDMAHFLGDRLAGSTSLTYESPVKAAVKPVAKAVTHFVTDTVGLVEVAGGTVVLVVALLVIFGCLVALVKILKALMSERLEGLVHRALSKGPIVTMGIGLVVTASVQSSSITTSILVPLVATGLVQLEHAFPITLGANVGTTVTALLASLAGNVHGLAIALVHTLFNLSGILLFYPFGPLRRLPIRMARWLGDVAGERRVMALVFIAVVFFAIPLVVIFVERALS